MTVANSAERSKTKALQCSQRVFPQTHEPSVTTARCLCSADPGPTVRPPASASPQPFSTDAARQANFLRCRSGDIFQVERCTFFRAHDHGTNARTRIFARVASHFVEMGENNLHTQTLTAAPILVTSTRSKHYTGLKFGSKKHFYGRVAPEGILTLHIEIDLFTAAERPERILVSKCTFTRHVKTVVSYNVLILYLYVSRVEFRC